MHLPYAPLFILVHLLLQAISQLLGSGALQGRFLLPGGQGGDATRCSPGLSVVVVLSWGALRGKGKGDVEGVNGGDWLIQMWTDRETERGKDRAACVGRPSGTWGDRDTHREKEAEFQMQ